MAIQHLLIPFPEYSRRTARPGAPNEISLLPEYLSMSTPDAPSTSSGLLRLLAAADEAAWMTFVERYSPLIDDTCRAARLRQADIDEVRSRVLYGLVRALQNFQYDP